MEIKRTEIGISTETLIKIVAIVLGLLFLWTIKDVLIILLISIILASALEPLVEYLNTKKVPRVVSVLAVYLLGIGFLVLLGYLVFPPLFYEFQQLSSGDISEALSSKLGHNVFLSQYNIADIVSNGLQTFGIQLTSLTDNFFQQTFSVFTRFLEVITILVISFYLVAEKSGMKNFIVSLVPEKHQGFTINLVTKIQNKIGLWLLGQFIVSFFIFALTYIALSLLGIQYALVLAILAGFFEIIPYIGPFVSAIPALFFAYIQNPALAIVVALLYLIIQKLEGYVLVPKIMQKTIGVSPLVIMVAIIVGLKIAGIFGVILAVPLVAAANVAIQEWRIESAKQNLEKQAEIA